MDAMTSRWRCSKCFVMLMYYYLKWPNGEIYTKQAMSACTHDIFCVHFHQIARLREEGSRQLEEEQRLIREQIQREREAQQSGGSLRDMCPIPRFSFFQFVLVLKNTCAICRKTHPYSFNWIQNLSPVEEVVVSLNIYSIILFFCWATNVLKYTFSL